MKPLLIALTFLFCTLAPAKAPSELIIGKWRPVEKAEAVFTWEFRQDGMLIVKGDNGNAMAVRWRLDEPDTLIITGLPKATPPQKIKLEEGKLSVKDDAGNWHDMALVKD